ncbi:MAG: hypothetical protein Q6363_007535 [Candidatus Njordarchaeota archaeon]
MVSSILLKTVKLKDERILAFGLGFLSRVISEIIAGKYPVGYDTSTYYVLFAVEMNWFKQISHAPLYQYILFLVVMALGGNILIAIKILSCFICGFFTYSLYIWGQSNGISKENLLKFVAIVYFYFAVFRIAWDLQRNVLGLSLVLLTFSYYKKSKNILVVGMLGFLACISHQFSAFVLLALFIPELMKPNIRVITTLFAGLIGFAVIVFFTWGTNLESVLASITIFYGKKYIYVPIHLMPLFIFWLSLPILPFILWYIYGFFNKEFGGIFKYINKNNISWVLLTFILAPIFVIYYRLIFMAFIPIILFVFNVVVSSDKKNAMRLLILAVAFSSSIYPAVSYVYPMYSEFRKTAPGCLFASTVAPWDAQHFENLFREAISIIMSKKNVTLIVHHLQIAIAYAAGVDLLGQNVYITSADDTFEEPLRVVLNMSDGALIVWYVTPIVGAWSLPNGNFTKISQSGSVALYLYFSCAINKFNGA